MACGATCAAFADGRRQLHALHDHGALQGQRQWPTAGRAADSLGWQRVLAGAACASPLHHTGRRRPPLPALRCGQAGMQASVREGTHPQAVLDPVEGAGGVCLSAAAGGIQLLAGGLERHLRTCGQSVSGGMHTTALRALQCRLPQCPPAQPRQAAAASTAACATKPLPAPGTRVCAYQSPPRRPRSWMPGWR